MALICIAELIIDIIYSVFVIKEISIFVSTGSTVAPIIESVIGKPYIGCIFIYGKSGRYIHVYAK